MGINNDEQLLQEYLSSGSETAFSHLVERYTGLVFGVAMRSLGQPAAAEEVTQNVFVILSRKAKHLARRPEHLPGWLHRAAVFESRNYKQRDRTRERNMQAYQNEQEAGLIRESASDANDLPLTQLDAAIDSLSHSDRRLVFLRFFEERRYKEIGDVLEKSEDACQKQVTRILTRLGTFLRRRGTTVSTGALAAVLSTEFAKAAPPTLEVTLASQALTGSHTLTQTQLLMHTYPTLLSTKAAIALGSAVLIAAPLIWIYTLRADEKTDSQSPTSLTAEVVAETLPLVSVETTVDQGAGESDILLIKSNPDGSQAWSRTFGGTSYERASNVKPTPDGGYIIIGSTSSFGRGNYDVWLVKTDQDGQQEWSADYGTFFNDYGLDVVVDGKGDYLLGGTQQVCEDENVSDSCDDLPWLAKVDSKGKLLWERLGEEALEGMRDASMKKLQR